MKENHINSVVTEILRYRQKNLLLYIIGLLSGYCYITRVNSYLKFQMKDLSLKDRTGLPNERIYNKIQDYVWDEILGKVRLTYFVNLSYLRFSLLHNTTNCYS